MRLNHRICHDDLALGSDTLVYWISAQLGPSLLARELGCTLGDTQHLRNKAELEAL